MCWRICTVSWPCSLRASSLTGVTSARRPKELEGPQVMLAHQRKTDPSVHSSGRDEDLCLMALNKNGLKDQQRTRSTRDSTTGTLMACCCTTPSTHNRRCCFRGTRCSETPRAHTGTMPGELCWMCYCRSEPPAAAHRRHHKRSTLDSTSWTRPACSRTNPSKCNPRCFHGRTRSGTPLE